MNVIEPYFLQDHKCFFFFVVHVHRSCFFLFGLKDLNVHYCIIVCTMILPLNGRNGICFVLAIFAYGT